MLRKTCPYCRKDSYSSYNDPNWLCPYCGQNIGSTACISEKFECNGGKSKQEGRIIDFYQGRRGS